MGDGRWETEDGRWAVTRDPGASKLFSHFGLLSSVFGLRTPIFRPIKFVIEPK
jgi:hypothetical protein